MRSFCLFALSGVSLVMSSLFPLFAEEVRDEQKWDEMDQRLFSLNYEEIGVIADHLAEKIVKRIGFIDNLIDEGVYEGKKGIYSEHAVSRFNLMVREISSYFKSFSLLSEEKKERVIRALSPRIAKKIEDVFSEKEGIFPLELPFEVSFTIFKNSHPEDFLLEAIEEAGITHIDFKAFFSTYKLIGTNPPIDKGSSVSLSFDPNKSIEDENITFIVFEEIAGEKISYAKLCF